MCEAYAGEARHVAYLEKKHGRCPVCKKLTIFCPWYCEGSERFREYVDSPMFDQDRVIPATPVTP